eukprot:3785435-Prymnesium_polylepis.1
MVSARLIHFGFAGGVRVRRQSWCVCSCAGRRVNEVLCGLGAPCAARFLGHAHTLVHSTDYALWRSVVWRCSTLQCTHPRGLRAARTSAHTPCLAVSVCSTWPYALGVDYARGSPSAVTHTPRAVRLKIEEVRI